MDTKGALSKTYHSTKAKPNGTRKSRLTLLNLRAFGSDNETGVAVTSYGQGQLTGVMYTVPAHGEITVEFKLKLLCVTPEDVATLNKLIRSLLDATHQHLFDELQKTEISGGISFFGFFGWGGGSASYSDTKRTMDSFGLSERNQEAIIDSMMKIAQTVSEFNYSGTIYNLDYDYDVTGNLFGVVMDAAVKQSQYQRQLRFLAPEVHLTTSDGSTLPVIGQIYDQA